MFLIIYCSGFRVRREIPSSSWSFSSICCFGSDVSWDSVEFKLDDFGVSIWFSLIKSVSSSDEIISGSDGLLLFCSLLLSFFSDTGVSNSWLFSSSWKIFSPIW